MDLANMRSLGVRSIDAMCQAKGCGHEARVNVDKLPDDMFVPDVGLRMVCSSGRRLAVGCRLTGLRGCPVRWRKGEAVTLDRGAGGPAQILRRLHASPAAALATVSARPRSAQKRIVSG